MMLGIAARPGGAGYMAILLLAGATPAAPLFETTCVFPVTPENKPNYRIPAILQALNGDLLILAEKRNDGPGDVGNTDIILKRSRDKGRTWSAEQVIFDDGDRFCADITVGLDRDTKKLWLFFVRDKKQFACMTSTDSGATWQGPVRQNRLLFASPASNLRQPQHPYGRTNLTVRVSCDDGAT